MPDEPDRPMDILFNFGNDKARLRSMNHRKYRVASGQKWLVRLPIDCGMIRKEPAAHHEDYAEAVWRFRLENVQCQGRSKLPAIDHIFRALESSRGTERGECNQQRDQ